MAAPAAITAGAGLVSGLMGNKHAQSAANKAQAFQQKIGQRAMELYDTLYGKAETADQNGTFSNAHRTAMMEATGQRSLDAGQRAIAGSALASGANPGDTNIAAQRGNLNLRYAQGMAQNADALKQESFWDTQKAYSSAADAGGMMGAASSNALAQQQMALGQLRDPSQLVGSAMPFFGSPSHGYGPSGVPGTNVPGAPGSGGTPSVFDPNWNGYWGGNR